MGNTNGEKRFVEHAPDCAHVLEEQDTCNCFLSENTNLLAATSVFEPATAEGPADINGEFDEQAQAAILEFVTRKKLEVCSFENLTTQSTSNLYQTLKGGEIRILELIPAQAADPLQGALHVASIDFTHPWREETDYAYSWKGHGRTHRRHTNHAVSLTTGKPIWYTALSYVWGAPIFDHGIEINEERIQITGSLARALHRLRSFNHSVYLWIDQLCINQQDISEKVQQIPLMDKIYTNATNTVIWLGDDNGEDPVLALEAMQNIYGRLQLSDVEISTDDFARLDFPPPDDPSWSAIRKILLRPWFTRLWTIQEAILSRNLFIKCGDAVACWDDVAAWCYVLEHCNLLRWLDVSTSDQQKSSTAITRQLLGGFVINSLQADRLQDMMLEGKEYLLNSLVRTRYAQATDPKDKVYGVLGIAESSIIPNYSREVKASQVYHAACLTQMPQLTYEVLSCVDHSQPLKPSWVPDWSAPRVTEALGYSTKAWTLYYTGGKSVPGQDALSGYVNKAFLSADKLRLTLSAIRFDTTMDIGPISESPDLDIDYPHKVNSDLAAYVDMVKRTYTSSEYSSSKFSVYDAFWRTLVAGRDGSGTAAPTQEHDEVFSLILDSTTGQMPSLPGQIYSPRRQKGFFTLKSLRTRKPAKTLDDLRTAIRSSLTMRRFALTHTGYFALVPRGTRQGDEIMVFDKACVPFVVRRIENPTGVGRIYELLGEAYVQGIMQGEVMTMPELKFEDVTLV